MKNIDSGIGAVQVHALKMGVVRITSLNPKFNWRQFGLPPSSIHRMTGWVAISRLLWRMRTAPILFSFSSDKDRRINSRIRRKKHSAAPLGIKPRVLRIPVARSNPRGTAIQSHNKELRANFCLSIHQLSAAVSNSSRSVHNGVYPDVYFYQVSWASTWTVPNGFRRE